jgi:hypothetical protein
MGRAKPNSVPIFFRKVSSIQKDRRLENLVIGLRDDFQTFPVVQGTGMSSIRSFIWRPLPLNGIFLGNSSSHR